MFPNNFTIEEVRNALHLSNGIWRDFPDELVKLAFKQKDYPNIKDELSIDNRELYEFFGDAVLQLLSSRILLDTEQGPELTPQTATNSRSLLIKNSTLQCLFNMKGLCHKGRFHHCADSFEALVGAMYWWLYRNNNKDPLTLVEDWLDDVFAYKSVAEFVTSNLNDYGRINICNVFRNRMDRESSSEGESSSSSEEESLPSPIRREPSPLRTRSFTANPAEAAWSTAIIHAYNSGALPVKNIQQLLSYTPLQLAIINGIENETEKELTEIAEIAFNSRENYKDRLSNIYTNRDVQGLLNLGSYFGLFPRITGYAYTPSGFKDLY